jgi:phosphinothricin acetyltransferase
VVAACARRADPRKPGGGHALTAISADGVRHGRASLELEPPTGREIGLRRQAVLPHGHDHLVAEADGRLLGDAHASAFRTRPADRVTVETSVDIAPGLHRSGAGRALMTELIARCEAKGFRLMVAVIGDSANTPSIGLHAAMGLRHARLLPGTGWTHEPWVDTVLITRVLGAGQSSPPAG